MSTSFPFPLLTAAGKVYDGVDGSVEPIGEGADANCQAGIDGRPGVGIGVDGELEIFIEPRLNNRAFKDFNSC